MVNPNRWLAAAGVMVLAAAVGIAPGPAPASAAAADAGWTGTWSVAYENSGGVFPAQSTARQIVHTSIGGTMARLRLSNVFNDEPLTLSDFHLAQRSSGASIVASTDRAVTFGGQSSVTIPAGGQATSDPVSFQVLAESDAAVSFYVPVRTEGVSSKQFAFSEQYLANGNVTGATSLAVTQTYSSYFIVSDLEVMNPAATGAVVALGASITEGHLSSFNANRRWTNLLATRLNASGRTVGVLNEGIAGNQLLGVGVGPSALDRFDRDVLSRSGVRSVIFSDNPINDLGSGREPTGAQLIDGLQQLIVKAHGAGVAFYCTTLTPFEGSSGWTSSREIARGQYNAYVRGANSGCDATIDFDTATHDPAAPTKFRPDFDSGDHLHPNDAGMQAMANVIPLTLFGSAAPTPPPLTLAESYNNVAVTTDANTNPGNFDGGGASFSAEALAGVGVRAGGTVTAAGLALTWPAGAGTGQRDNTIATGQTIALSGTGNTLGLLFSTSYGPVTGTGSVQYTDGTVQAFDVTSPDWFVTNQPGGGVSLAAVAPYQNRQGNTRFDGPAALFAEAVPLASAKTVASVKLPNLGVAPVQSGVPSLHLFAMTVGTVDGGGSGTHTLLSRTGWSASASPSSATDVPARMLDGNASTRWSTGTAMAPGQTVTVDMGAVRNISQITMDSAGSTGDYARSYQVSLSSDGVNWGPPVATGTGTGPLVTVGFPATTARYIRVTQTGSSSTWWSIAEFNAYS
ncbi:discoidin domain-containing protein [Micromonospora sp. NPDC005367]|uniref:discoidin domain-containing protein n=1 Tax=Micromonospora sp. NPDC005367 TaxID=3155590 RepID=UPI0033AAD277